MPSINVINYGMLKMRDTKKIAVELYEAMNRLDCGCTEDGQESVDLQENGRTAEFYQLIDGSDKYKMLIIDSEDRVLYHKIVGYAELSEGDQSTIDMFKRMLDYNAI